MDQENDRLVALQNELDWLTSRYRGRATPERRPPSRGRVGRYALQDEIERMMESAELKKNELAQLKSELDSSDKERQRSDLSLAELSKTMGGHVIAIKDISVKLDKLPEKDASSIIKKSIPHLSAFLTPPEIQQFQNADPEKQLTELQNLGADISKTSSDMHNQIDKLQTRLDKHSEETKVHNEAIQQFSDELEQLKNKAQPVQRQKQKLEDELVFSRQELDECNLEIDGFQKRLPALEKQHSDLMKHREVLSLEIEEMTERTTDLLHEMQALTEVQKKGVESSFGANTKKPPAGSAATSAKMTEKEYQFLREQYAQKDAEAKRLGTVIIYEHQPALEKMDQELQSLEKHILQNQKKYDQVKNQHVVISENKKQLETELQDVKKELLDLEKKQVPLNEWLSSVTDGYQTSKAKEQTVRMELQTVIKDVGELVKQIETNQLLRQEYAPVVRGRQQRRELSERRFRHEQELEQLNEKYSLWEVELRDKEQTVHELHTQHFEQTKLLEELELDLGRLQFQLDALPGSPHGSPVHSLTRRGPQTMEEAIRIDELENEIDSIRESIAELRSRQLRSLQGQDSTDYELPQAPPDTPVRTRRASAPAILEGEQINPVRSELPVEASLEMPARNTGSYRIPEVLEWLQSYFPLLPWMAPYVVKGSISGSGFMVYLTGEQAWYARLKSESDLENALRLLIAREADSYFKSQPACPVDNPEQNAFGFPDDSLSSFRSVPGEALKQFSGIQPEANDFFTPPERYGFCPAPAFSPVTADKNIELPPFGQKEDFPWDYLFEMREKNMAPPKREWVESRYPMMLYYDPDHSAQCPLAEPNDGFCQAKCNIPDPFKVLIDLAKPAKLMIHPMMGQCPARPQPAADFESIVKSFYIPRQTIGTMPEKKPVTNKRAPPEEIGSDRNRGSPGKSRRFKARRHFEPAKKPPQCPASDKPEYVEDKTGSQGKPIPDSWTPDSQHDSPPHDPEPLYEPDPPVCEAEPVSKSRSAGSGTVDDIPPEKPKSEQYTARPKQDLPDLGDEPVCPAKPESFNPTTKPATDLPNSQTPKFSTPYPHIQDFPSNNIPHVAPPVFVEDAIIPPPVNQGDTFSGTGTCPAPAKQFMQAAPEQVSPEIQPVPYESVAPLPDVTPVPEPPSMEGSGVEDVLQITYQPEIEGGTTESYTPTVEELIDIINRNRQSPAVTPEPSAQNSALAIRFDENLLGPQTCNISEAPQTCPITDAPQAQTETDLPTQQKDPVTGHDTRSDQEFVEQPQSQGEDRPETSPESKSAESKTEEKTEDIPPVPLLAKQAAYTEPERSIELIPEFETLANMANLSGMMQMHTLSGLKLVASRIWQNYSRQRGNPEFFSEILSFAQGNSQFVRHEFSAPVYTFIHGSQQSGDHLEGQWGGSSFSWGAVGFSGEQVMFGLMLSKQKLNLSITGVNTSLRTESQSCYSLLSFKLGQFDVMTVGGISWPDFRYRRNYLNDRFSSSQWLGYAALSRRFVTDISGLGFGISPSLEILKAHTSTYGHTPSGNMAEAPDIERVQSEVKVVQTGLTLDTQFGDKNNPQNWQIYFGWQTIQGNQNMNFNTGGLPDNFQSGIAPARNVLMNVGVSQSLGKHLSVQLSINGSWGDQGNHQGMTINYVQQF